LAYISSAQRYKSKTVLLASCNTCRFATYFFRIVLCWLLRPPDSLKKLQYTEWTQKHFLISSSYKIKTYWNILTKLVATVAWIIY
jgi:hypothetical protein